MKKLKSFTSLLVIYVSITYTFASDMQFEAGRWFTIVPLSTKTSYSSQAGFSDPELSDIYPICQEIYELKNPLLDGVDAACYNLGKCYDSMNSILYFLNKCYRCTIKFDGYIESYEDRFGNFYDNAELVLDYYYDPPSSIIETLEKSDHSDYDTAFYNLRPFLKDTYFDKFLTLIRKLSQEHKVIFPRIKELKGYIKKYYKSASKIVAYNDKIDMYRKRLRDYTSYPRYTRTYNDFKNETSYRIRLGKKIKNKLCIELQAAEFLDRNKIKISIRIHGKDFLDLTHEDIDSISNIIFTIYEECQNNNPKISIDFINTNYPENPLLMKNYKPHHRINCPYKNEIDVKCIKPIHSNSQYKSLMKAYKKEKKKRIKVEKIQEALNDVTYTLYTYLEQCFSDRQSFLIKFYLSGEILAEGDVGEEFIENENLLIIDSDNDNYGEVSSHSGVS